MQLMLAASTLTLYFGVPGAISAERLDDRPELDFLEWLGQTSEVEQLGVDLDALFFFKIQQAQANKVDKRKVKEQ